MGLISQEPIRWGMRNERNAAAIEVEVVEAEANATHPFVGVEVKTQVVAAALPAQFDVGVDDIPVIAGARVDIHIHPGAQKQRADDLLGDADADSSEVNNPVELEGAGTIAQRATTDQRDLGEVQKRLTEGSEGEGRTATEAEAFLVIARSIDGCRGVDIGVETEARDHGNG